MAAQLVKKSMISLDFASTRPLAECFLAIYWGVVGGFAPLHAPKAQPIKNIIGPAVRHKVHWLDGTFLTD